MELLEAPITRRGCLDGYCRPASQSPDENRSLGLFPAPRSKSSTNLAPSLSKVLSTNDHIKQLGSKIRFEYRHETTLGPLFSLLYNRLNADDEEEDAGVPSPTVNKASRQAIADWMTTIDENRVAHAESYLPFEEQQTAGMLFGLCTACNHFVKDGSNFAPGGAPPSSLRWTSSQANRGPGVTDIFCLHVDPQHGRICLACWEKKRLEVLSNAHLVALSRQSSLSDRQGRQGFDLSFAADGKLSAPPGVPKLPALQVSPDSCLLRDER